MVKILHNAKLVLSCEPITANALVALPKTARRAIKVIARNFNRFTFSSVHEHSNFECLIIKDSALPFYPLLGFSVPRLLCFVLEIFVVSVISVITRGDVYIFYYRVIRVYLGNSLAATYYFAESISLSG